MPKPGVFRPGDTRINRRGRPPVGQSLADRVRAVVGTDGRKLVDMWCAIAFQRFPTPDKNSSSVTYGETLRAFSEAALLDDRLLCSRFLADRGFGKPKETLDHSGTIATRVVHEYHPK